MATRLKSDDTKRAAAAEAETGHARGGRRRRGPAGLRREEPRRVGSLGAPLHGHRAQGLDGAPSCAGGSGASPSPSSGFCRASRREPTSSSSGAAPHRSRRGSPAPASGRSPSTSRARSSTSRPACRRSSGSSFPLIHANAEDVPYESESFDLAVSEYGASLWCEPHRWLAEADRLLRPGGGLIFVTNSPLLMACTPEGGERAGDRLLRDYFTSPVREYPRRRRRVPPDARRLDRAPQRLRLRGRAARRAAPAARNAAPLRLRVDRVGSALAQRGDLGRAQAAVAPARGVSEGDG